VRDVSRVEMSPAFYPAVAKESLKDCRNEGRGMREGLECNCRAEEF